MMTGIVPPAAKLKLPALVVTNEDEAAPYRAGNKSGASIF
jgi:hypothetical protein